MKKILMFILLFGIVCKGFSQEMTVGKNLLSLGMGLTPGVGVSMNYDYGLIETWKGGIFTIGAFAGVDSHTERLEPVGIAYTNSKWFFAPRVTYRYTIIPKLELYGAGMVGIALERYKYNNHFNPEYERANHNHADFALTVGARYCLTEMFSLYSEVGYNVSYITMGLSFDF